MNEPYAFLNRVYMYIQYDNTGSFHVDMVYTANKCMIL